MFRNDFSTEPPFWLDDPNPYLPQVQKKGFVSAYVADAFSIFNVAWRIVLALFLVLFAFRTPWLWFLIAYLVMIALVRLAVIRRVKNVISRSAEIQKLAREKTGASTIGSAIHTAGHPRLEPNQPVVLALKDGSLSIYSYASAVPLDTIGLIDILALDLVSYDDDGNPHTGVVDTTAQALQMKFTLRSQVYTCLFRRMYKVRAVGWYHAIQAARAAVQPTAVG